MNAILLVFLLALPAYAIIPASDQENCGHMYASLNIGKSREQDPAHQFAEQARQELLLKSATLTQSIRQANANNKPVVLDIAVIGGGPQSAIFTSTARAVNPNAKILTFEAHKTVGTFDEIGPSVWMYSPETREGSGNLLRGSTVQLRQFNPNLERYPPGQNFGDATLVSHYANNNKIIFGQKIAKVEEATEGVSWPARYKITSEDGLFVFSNKIVDARGIGSASIGVKDPDSLAMLASETKKVKDALAQGKQYVPLVESQTEAHTRATQIAAKKMNFLDLYENKTVAVYGDTVGGQAVTEILAGDGPAMLYPLGKEKAKNIKIIWIGPKEKSLPGYRAQYPERRVYPYFGNALESNNFTTREGRVVSWRTTLPEEADKGKIAVFLEDVKDPIYTDHIISAAGFQLSEADNIYKPLLPVGIKEAKIERQNILSKLPYSYPGAATEPEPIARQIFSNGKKQNIFIVGQALDIGPGKGSAASEWQNAIGMNIDVVGRRTEAFAESFVASGNAPTGLLPLKASTAKGSGWFWSSVPMPARTRASQNTLATADLDLRVRLQPVLTKLRLPEGSELQMLLTSDGKIGFSGVDGASAERLKKLVNDDEPLKQALQNFFLLGKKQVEINLPIHPDGRPALEGLLLDYTN